MEWLLPILIFAVAAVFWVLSYCTQDVLVFWCRFMLASFLLLLALIYSIAIIAQGLMA